MRWARCARLAPADDAAFLLRTKAGQFERALSAALALDLLGMAVPPGAEIGVAAELGAVVPGQRLAVDLSLAGSSLARLSDVELQVETPTNWRVAPEADAHPSPDGTIVRRMLVTIGGDARLARAAFTRTSLMQHRYTGAERAMAPFAAPEAIAVARFQVDGVPVTLRSAVRRREARLPYGYIRRELQVVPALSLTLRPGVAIVPSGREVVTLTVDVGRAEPGAAGGTLTLDAPPGWEVRPARVTLAPTPVEERFDFTLHRVGATGTEGSVTAVATVGGKTYREGYQTIEHRDLEPRYLFREARSVLRAVDVTLPGDLAVGYVMGIGDALSAAIGQLGARVQLLQERDLATGQLDRFDAIVVGTRAYAVRADLDQFNDRLLGYAERGGHLIVLYSTQEFDPSRHAPFPGELPRRAEEVSEEDAAVDLLVPDHPVLRWPNRIGPGDFEGWAEQRGSKFLSAWAPAYTAIVSSHDLGQPEQRGGWLTARHGSGHYTYFAYALHRQLPFGVPGAYRILANLLSMGRAERAVGG